MGKSRLSYANVMATLAFVVALTGGTTAVAVSTKLSKNSVTTKSVRNGNVTAPKLAAIRVVAGAPNATATCGAGERLIGGGARGTANNPAMPSSLLTSYPSGNSWVASPGVNANVVPYALCLSAKPGA